MFIIQLKGECHKTVYNIIFFSKIYSMYWFFVDVRICWNLLLASGFWRENFFYVHCREEESSKNVHLLTENAF